MLKRTGFIYGVFTTMAAMPALVLPALAQSLPGNVPAEIVGDWSCGETRAYITKLGSIELLGNGYRAGKFDAKDGAMRIGWDEGGEETWNYEAGGGETLSLTDAAGAVMNCTPKT